MLESLPLVFSQVGLRELAVFCFLALAILYYKRFINYRFFMKTPYDPKRKNIGDPLPPYPNGWFMAAKSEELAPKQVKNLQKWGVNVVLFRGEDQKVYALDAYCAHMGANMGVEGKVKNGNLIQCPFHGWSYDGETGYCVDHNKKPIRGVSVEYAPGIGECAKKVEWVEKEEDIRLRKYPVVEQNGYIFIWLHGNKEFQNNPFFQVPNISSIMDQLSFRGTALNVIRCHIQDIPENGADIMHFFYVHKYLFQSFKQLWVRWIATWTKGDSADIREKFTHKISYVDEFKKKIYECLFKNYTGGQYLGVVNVDSYVNLPLISEFFGFNITVVQVGSGVVYIFVKTYFFTLCFVQYVQTDGKYTQNVYHDLYCSKWMPFWLSAFFLRAESTQVYNDAKVWDAKQFKRKVFYQKDSKADSFLKGWREWYGQFYDGAENRIRQDLDW